VQHWLKVLHSFSGAEQRSVGDPHRISRDGEPVMRPAYAIGDLLLVYVAGTHRCPGVVEVVEEAEYDPARERWGWRTPVRCVIAVEDGGGPWLDDVGVPSRAVGRQSRLRLRPEQFARGYEALSRAAAAAGRPASR
jgi:hypothetical protein